MTDAAPATVALRDGSSVIVRPIEPADKPRLLAGFERMSPQSRYRRFLSATPRLSASALAYLTEVDHHDHEALVGIDPRTGEGLGVARYVRGERPDAAEAAVAVVDDAQGRGLGTALLERLAQRARDEEVQRFTATVLSQNTDVIDMLERLGSAEVDQAGNGLLEVEVDLSPGEEEPARPHLPELLRAAATGALELVKAPGHKLRGDER